MICENDTKNGNCYVIMVILDTFHNIMASSNSGMNSAGQYINPDDILNPLCAAEVKLTLTFKATFLLFSLDLVPIQNISVSSCDMVCKFSQTKSCFSSYLEEPNLVCLENDIVR